MDPVSVNPAPAPSAVPVADTVAISGGMEREAITPAQFIAELEAAGAVPGPNAAAGEGPEATGEAKVPAEGDAKPDDAAKVDPPAEGDKPPVVEAKADDKLPEPKPDDSPDVKAARKIYKAAARLEAATLQTAKENKALKANLEQLAKLRDEDALAFLEAVGFGKGTEKDPVKDLLSRVIAKGEKPVQTAEDRIAALESRLATEKAENDRRAQAENVRVYQLQVAEQVKAAGDRFDLVNAFEAHDQVWEVMAEYHAAHGVAPDPMVAAEQVEKYLASKVGRSTKFKAPGPAASAAKPGTSSNANKPTSNATGKSETLTNTGSGTLEADDLPMDDHDARAKAAAKAVGLAFIRN